jgi:hypothetical protein
MILRNRRRGQQQKQQQGEADTHVRIVAKLSLSLYKRDGYGLLAL